MRRGVRSSTSISMGPSVAMSLLVSLAPASSSRSKAHEEAEARGTLEVARAAGLASHGEAGGEVERGGEAGSELELLDHIVVVRHMLTPAPATPLLLQDIMGCAGDPSRAKRADLLRRAP